MARCMRSSTRIVRSTESSRRGAADRSVGPLPPLPAAGRLARRPARVQQDACLQEASQRVFAKHHEVYAVRKIRNQRWRDGVTVARSTVERLMRSNGLRGVVRGQRPVTTRPETAAPCPQDLVQRQFTAARLNQRWVADFTYVATCRAGSDRQGDESSGAGDRPGPGPPGPPSRTSLPARARHLASLASA